MDAAELLKRVQQVDISTRSLSDRIFSGEYQSAFKGRGMAFAENREYQAGDEVRTIDWNVTARTGTPHVKVFEEERELTVFLLIDVSASVQGGTRERTQMDLISELSAILAFSAIGNSDKVGAVLFSDRIEKYIPPGKGRSHVLRMVRDILDCRPKGQGSDVAKALQHFITAMRKRTVAFLISDFKGVEADGNLETLLRRAGRRHDLVALHTDDPLNRNMPSLGWVQLEDPETGTWRWRNTSSRVFQKSWGKNSLLHRQEVAKITAKAGIDCAHLSTESSIVPPLLKLFHGRA